MRVSAKLKRYKAVVEFKSILPHFIASPAYRATFTYLLGELMRLFRWRFLRVLVLSFIAAGAQVGAIVLIINTVNVLANGGEFELYGFSMIVEPSFEMVIGLAAIPVVLLAVATIAMFKSRLQIARMMIDYHSHLDRGVYRGGALLVRQPADSETKRLLDPAELTSMVGKDGRFAGRVINEVATSVVPVAAVCIILRH